MVKEEQRRRVSLILIGHYSRQFILQCACARITRARVSRGVNMATPEVLLARKLASNDLETRQKAEKSLKKWLSVKAVKGMKEIEMKRLWKGLFACMYMSDKPLVQVSHAY